MTQLLYNESAYQKEFAAVVLSCIPGENGTFDVTLDKTAFFPEQGGQYADRGVLGGADVLDVQMKNGTVIHTVSAPLTPGKTVTGNIEWDTRYDRMQNHTGEHILSGFLHAEYGYENVGFHMNDDFLTLDTTGELTWEQLSAAEDYANRIVRENFPIVVSYPDAAELEMLDYRSKLELSEDVRIVTIPGVDVCACCAPHVAYTGEIGLVKIVDAIRYKGGMRLTVLCGERARRDYVTKHAVLSDIAVTLCTKPEEAAAGVARLQNQIYTLKGELAAVRRELLSYKIAALPETDSNLCIFEEGADNSTLRSIVNAGTEKCTGICAAFSGNDTDGYLFVIGAKNVPLRARAKEITTALGGRGGGSDAMISGSVRASAETIRAYIAGFC